MDAYQSSPIPQTVKDIIQKAHLNGMDDAAMKWLLALIYDNLLVHSVLPQIYTNPYYLFRQNQHMHDQLLLLYFLVA
jgi:hypothetical protein